jgi:hypothetical protein
MIHQKNGSGQCNKDPAFGDIYGWKMNEIKEFIETKNITDH